MRRYGLGKLYSKKLIVSFLSFFSLVLFVRSFVRSFVTVFRVPLHYIIIIMQHSHKRTKGFGGDDHSLMMDGVEVLGISSVTWNEEKVCATEMPLGDDLSSPQNLCQTFLYSH